MRKGTLLEVREYIRFVEKYQGNGVLGAGATECLSIIDALLGAIPDISGASFIDSTSPRVMHNSLIADVYKTAKLLHDATTEESNANNSKK